MMRSSRGRLIKPKTSASSSSASEKRVKQQGRAKKAPEPSSLSTAVDRKESEPSASSNTSKKATLSTTSKTPVKGCGKSRDESGPSSTTSRKETSLTTPETSVRGRKKSKESEPSSPATSRKLPQPTTAEKPVRRRGRPKKEAATGTPKPEEEQNVAKEQRTSEDADESAKKVGVRTRGKRVKVCFNDDDDEDDDEDDGVWTPKGIRGRGKAKQKGKDSPDEEEKEEEDEDWEEEVEESDGEVKTPASATKRRKGGRKAKGGDTSGVKKGKATGKTKDKGGASTPRKRRRRVDVDEEAEEPASKKTETGEEEEIPASKFGSSLSVADQKKYGNEIKKWEKEFEEFHYLYAKCPECHCRRRSMETLLLHYKECTSIQTNCQKCGAQFGTFLSLKYHMLSEHHAVVDGDGQITESNDLATIKAVLTKTGRLKCQIECDKVFRSIQGYQEHIKVCGKNVTYDCKLCGKVYTSYPGLKYHINKYHERVATSASEDDTWGTMPTETKTSKRRAATRALKTLKDITEETKEHKAKEKKAGRNVKNLYNTVTRPEVPEDIMTKWKKTIKEGKEAQCAHHGCTKTYSTIGTIKSHYYQCGYRPDALKWIYTCKVCKKKMAIEVAMTIHIRNKHKEELDVLVNKDDDEADLSSGDDEDGDVDHELMCEEEDDDDDDEEDGGGEIEESDVKSSKVSSAKNRVLKGPYCLETTSSACFNGIRNALKWTTEQRRDRHCPDGEVIFEEFKSGVSDWQLLTEREAEAYEPTTSTSVPFRVVNRPAKPNPTFHRLTKYSVLQYNQTQYGDPNKGNKPKNSFTFFVGGPVWAMAWCPLPTRRSDTADQYAVISCHRTMDETHKTALRHQGPGSVQLWHFGILQHSGAKSEPTMCMGLAHDYGCVWNLKWCPSGCWEDPRSKPSSDKTMEDQSSEVRGDARLGLLGMACSDGTVRLVCVPHPKTDEVDKGAPMYKVKPVLSLFPCDQHGKETAPWFGQCWCLEWLPGDKHTQILASYSNGAVVLWNLHTTSPLLQTSSSTDGKILFPIQVFKMGDATIRSFAWCPLASNYIVTVCSDKRLQIWDLRDTGYPVMTRFVNQHVECRWLSHWSGFLASVDSSLCQHRLYAMVSYHECGYFGYNYFTATIHQSCVWGLDVSDWLNICVAVDAGGDAQCMVLPPLCHDMEHAKTNQLLNRRRSIYYTDMEKLSAVDKRNIFVEGGGDEPNRRETDTTSSDIPVTIDVENAANQDEEDASETCDSIRDACHENGDQYVDKRTNGDHGVAKDGTIGMDDVDKGRTNTELPGGKSQVLTGNKQSEHDDGAPVVIKTEPIDPDESTNESMNTDFALDPSDISAIETDVSANVSTIETDVSTNMSTIEMDVSTNVSSIETDVSTNVSAIETDVSANVSTIETDVSTNISAIETDVSTNVSAIETNVSTNVSGGDRTMDVEITGEKFEDEIAQLLQVCQEVKDSLKEPETPSDSRTDNNAPSSTCTDNPANPVEPGSLAPAPGTRTQAKAPDNKSVEMTKKGSKSGATEQSSSGLGEGQSKKGKKPRPERYAEMADDYALIYNDMDMSHFSNNRQWGWKAMSLPRLQQAKGMKEPPPDQFPLQALYKIACNPNYGSHCWVLTGGQAGIVRLHCMMGLELDVRKKMK